MKVITKIIITGVLLGLITACAPLGEREMDAKLDAIRQDTPTLITFLNNFPKGADLHNHASGAAYIEFGLIFARDNNYFYDLDKLKIVEKNNNSGNLITVAELFNREKDLQAFLDIVSARGWHRNTINGSDLFFSTFSHMSVPNYTNHYMAKIIARNHSQGVRYIELMTGVLSHELTAPLYTLLQENEFNIGDLEESYKKIESYLLGDDFKNGVNNDMDSSTKAIEAILYKEYGIATKGDTPDIIVRYIPQLRRSASPYDTFISAAANLQASKVDNLIVATNMVQVEAGLFSLIYFDDQMEILDFLWNKLDKPNIALHAGELVLRESPVEPMRNRISKSIITGHAQRIGHGISIAWEKDVAGTLKMMHDQDIPVEICLSSNDMILGIAGNDHPLDMYIAAGVPVTIATDDEGVSRSNLTNEYVRAAQEHDLSYSLLKKIAKNGLEYSFLNGDGIYADDGSVLPQFEEFLLGNLPTLSLLDNNAKAYLQIRHERDLAAFENKILNN